MIVPLTINYISAEQYGIWLTFSSIIAWFNFFDIGLGHGLRNKFAEAKANNNKEDIQTYISTTYAMLIIIFTTIWIIFFVANSIIDWSAILNTSPSLSKNLSNLAFITVSFFCIQIVLKTINVIIIADQNPAKAAFSDMIGQLLTLLIVILLSNSTKGSIVYLGIAIGFSPVVILIISTIYFFKNEYKKYKPKISKIELRYAKEIMSLGIKFFFIQIAAIIIFQTTNIIITQILGPKYVTLYNIAYKYFFTINMIFIIILSPFWSAFTEAYANKDYEWMKSSVKKLNKIWLCLIPLTVVMIISSNIFYKLWIGNSVIISLKISVAMAIYVLFFSRFNLYIYLINGTGKVNLQLFVNIILCILYIPIAIVLCKFWSIEGIILSNILIAMVHTIISQIQINKLINNHAKGIWNK